MDTSALKKFAQDARRALREQVTAKLDLVLAQSSAARREAPSAVAKLEEAVRAASRDQVIERVAYIWFNRFSALRFMDANGYTGVGVLSPREGETRPEILSEAMAGVIGAEVPPATADKARTLLDGRAPSRDPQGEAYRLLVVAACNHWHALMPFLFEPIADETELLMPDDLLSASSVPAKLRAVMTEEACKDVEIIGWLYQFYISEKKDQVFAALKKNVKITPENIPAATQLFTPHWIVRYLVENSLGRLWLLNRPQSKLAERMDYYIAPVEPETDFLPIERPQDIRMCDPACGSGHMLTYAFDLLHAIYEEEGHDAAEIPALILTHNLTGIEIDDRAGALAAFALAMKAAARLGRRWFLRMTARPNVCVLQDVRFAGAEMREVAAVVGRDLFTGELRETLGQFEQAKNFGSLIVPKLRDPAEVARVVLLKDFGSDLLLREVQARVLTVLGMAEALVAKYHVVVANPPYMAISNSNEHLKSWLMETYLDSKSDLFSAFIERGIRMNYTRGYLAMVTMESWMFLSSFEKLRRTIVRNTTPITMLHMPYIGKGGTSMGINFGTVAFCLNEKYQPQTIGTYFCVRHYECDDFGVPVEFPLKNERFAQVASSKFNNITGNPIAYWISDGLRAAFSRNPNLGSVADPRKGMVTADNPRFIRAWTEVSRSKMNLSASNRGDANISRCKWFPYLKGGVFRRWYGNQEFLVNWENDGSELLNMKGNGYKVGSTNHNLDYIFKPAISWTKVTSGRNAFRVNGRGFLFDDASALCAIKSQDKFHRIAAFLNAPVVYSALAALNPTMNLNPGTLSDVPYIDIADSAKFAIRCIELSRSDWDAYETSWDFTTLPLLALDGQSDTLEATYARLQAHWQNMTDEMQQLEQENNRLFIDAYGLQDELTPEVPLAEVTLTCNPAYRYGGGVAPEVLETRLRADTMAEFLSYAVGCIFGRYSLDKPGLILADQGDTLQTYLTKIPAPSFAPTADNVIPMLDGDWFADDVSERFRAFLRQTLGDRHFDENLAFIEAALGKDIRRYFVRDFFNDHVKRYKKRPIYWLFSSPQGTFNALIYMHRYTPDTVGVLLNEYLRPFRSKLEARKTDQQRLAIDPAATPAQRTRADKEIQALDKAILEIDAWERDVIYPLAARRIAIDLDDGVKANYPKFAGALKPIKGLEEAEE